MGADAYLFVFDHALYCNDIVPAFIRILKDGRVEPWLEEIQQKREESLYVGFTPPPRYDFRVFGGVDFEVHCTHLDPELASTLPPYAGSLYDSDWSLRACKSLECDARERCPFVEPKRKNPLAGDEEQFLDLLELALAQRCLGSSQFLGRSIDVYWYWNLLEELGVSQEDPIRRLLRLLGRRGYVVGYRWTVGTEGIHGWLTPNEAAELSERLFSLPLPDYNPSFSTMASFRETTNLLANYPSVPPFMAPGYKHATASFQELSLSFVRTVSLLASREGKGVLWGNDIYPAPTF